jgi:hypothetical protein
MPSEQLKLNKIIEKKKSKLEKKAEALEILCKENGNPINIIDIGEDYDLEKIEKDKRVSRKSFLIILRKYLSGPVFTDTFSKDHEKRREWELKNKEFLNKNKSKDIAKYYLSNRLGFNKNYNLIISIKNLFNLMKDSKLKEELRVIKDKIPLELTGDSDKKYHELEDMEKIEVVKKFSDVVKQLIAFLQNES